METRVSSTAKEAIIGGGRPTVLVGERINPTGKKKLAASLLAGYMQLVQQEAASQVMAGATCLIVDAAKVRPTALAVDLVLGRDNHARRYTQAYRERLKSQTPPS